MMPFPPSSSSSHSTDHSGSYVWMISVIAALGGLLFGYDWVVIGGAKPFYEKFFALSDPNQQGFSTAQLGRRAHSGSTRLFVSPDSSSFSFISLRLAARASK